MMHTHIHPRRSAVARLVSLIAVMALLAAACGGVAGDDGPADEAVGAEATSSEWSVSVLAAKDTTGVVPIYDAPDGNEVFSELPVANPTHFGNTLTLLVVDGEIGDDWVQVQLPVRSTDETGGVQPEVFAWVQTEFFEWASHEFHATVDLSDHTVQVWDGDDLVTESPAVTGRPAAPTPILRTYVDEIIPGDGAGYGSWILSLASYSQTLQTFDGGLPKLAIHGTNAPELVGQEVSSGCVRLPNEIMELLAATIPVGTVVEIVA